MQRLRLQADVCADSEVSVRLTPGARIGVVPLVELATQKPHLQLLAPRGWSGVSEEIRHEHRADLHQALAYASLADVAQVDTLLLCPSIGSESRWFASVARSGWRP